MENVTLRQNPDGLYNDPITTRLIISKFLVDVMGSNSKEVHDMLFECIHWLGKHMQRKKCPIIVKCFLDEEMQIAWGKRRMLHGIPYDISNLFSPQSQNARMDAKSLPYTWDISNHTIKTSKDKLPVDIKSAVVPGKHNPHALYDCPKELTNPC